jgi:hypothetical protein
VACLPAIVLLEAGTWTLGCGGGGAGSITPPPSPPPTLNVSVTPSSGTVLLGETLNFSAAVSNSSNTSVTWSVNGVTGDNAQGGTISADGVYTAPIDLPTGGTVQVTATSQADASKSASASVAVTGDISVSAAECGECGTWCAAAVSSHHPKPGKTRHHDSLELIWPSVPQCLRSRERERFLHRATDSSWRYNSESDGYKRCRSVQAGHRQFNHNLSFHSAVDGAGERRRGHKHAAGGSAHSGGRLQPKHRNELVFEWKRLRGKRVPSADRNHEAIRGWGDAREHGRVYLACNAAAAGQRDHHRDAAGGPQQTGAGEHDHSVRCEHYYFSRVRDRGGYRAHHFNGLAKRNFGQLVQLERQRYCRRQHHLRTNLRYRLGSLPAVQQRDRDRSGLCGARIDSFTESISHNGEQLHCADYVVPQLYYPSGVAGVATVRGASGERAILNAHANRAVVFCTHSSKPQITGPDTLPSSTHLLGNCVT